MRRLLEHTLAEIIDGLAPKGEAANMLSLREVVLTLPLEVSVTRGFEIVADFPQSRWRSELDRDVSQLYVSLKAMEREV